MTQTRKILTKSVLFRPQEMKTALNNHLIIAFKGGIGLTLRAAFQATNIAF